MFAHTTRAMKLVTSVVYSSKRDKRWSPTNVALVVPRAHEFKRDRDLRRSLKCWKCSESCPERRCRRSRSERMSASEGDRWSWLEGLITHSIHCFRWSIEQELCESIEWDHLQNQHPLLWCSLYTKLSKHHRTTQTISLFRSSGTAKFWSDERFKLLTHRHNLFHSDRQREVVLQKPLNLETLVRTCSSTIQRWIYKHSKIKWYVVNLHPHHDPMQADDQGLDPCQSRSPMKCILLKRKTLIHNLFKLDWNGVLGFWGKRFL